MIPDTLNFNLYGSKEFFGWFRGYDLLSTRKKNNLYRKLYHLLPFPLAEMLDKFYRKIGLSIHEESPERDSQPN